MRENGGVGAHEHLNPDQFVTMHRGVGDWGGNRWDGHRFSTAEELFDEMRENGHENFGQWWDPSEAMAHHYGLADNSGVVVSADFPRGVAHEVKTDDGWVIPRPNSGLVRRVFAVDDDGTRRVLPHTPGLRVQA